jgi:hypothetical protein
MLKLKKILAVWLVLLCISPFTVPFSTCDLATLAGHDTHEGGSLMQTVSTAAIIDGSVTHVLVPSMFGRTKFIAATANRTVRPGGTPPLWIFLEAGAPSNTLSQSISPGNLRI